MGEEVESLLEKGAKRESSREYSRFLLLPFLGPKKGGGAETCDQPETTKRIHQEENISHDNPQRSAAGYSP